MSTRHRQRGSVMDDINERYHTPLRNARAAVRDLSKLTPFADHLGPNHARAIRQGAAEMVERLQALVSALDAAGEPPTHDVTPVPPRLRHQGEL